MKPILKYPGAKWNLARWIVSYFPEHTRYLEPYCGSAAVFFNKAPVTHEILGDTNSSITNLFFVLREHGEELARRIDLTGWIEEDYEQFEKHYDDSGDPIEDARRFLLRSWQAHGGTIYQVSGWKHNGTRAKVYPTKLWKKLPERLLAAADRLKDAEIRNRPALELIAYYNTAETLIYADPPYLQRNPRRLLPLLHGGTQYRRGGLRTATQRDGVGLPLLPSSLRQTRTASAGDVLQADRCYNHQ